MVDAEPPFIPCAYYLQRSWLSQLQLRGQKEEKDEVLQPTSCFFRLPAPSPARTFYQSSNSPSRTNAALIFTMKFTSAILLCALLAAFLVLPTGAQSSEGEEGRGLGIGTGCPNANECLKSCRAKGHHVGACVPVLNVCTCV
ncbi:hypothetical protein MTO96_048782 [Rhipicephalus appendiculatus]